MKRKFIILILACLFVLSACSGNPDNDASGKNTEKKKEDETNFKELIGKTIEVKDDTIILPFKDIVQEAKFSNDGEVKVLRTPNYIVVIDGEEIIHTDKMSSADKQLTGTSVSEDGRFVTWRGLNDDWELSVYNVENRQLNVVEKNDTHDPMILTFPPLIEKHDDIYYLVDNQYMFGFEIYAALDLVNEKLYVENYEEDHEMLDKLSPKSRTTNEETYVAMENLLYKESQDRGLDYKFDSIATDYGNYELFFDYKESDDPYSLMTELLGADTKKGDFWIVPLEDESIDLQRDELTLNSSEVSMSENGHVLLPIFEEHPDKEYTYKIAIYHTDISKDSPNIQLLSEHDFTNYSEGRPSLLLNADESGFYLSEEGILNFSKFSAK